MAGDWIKMRSNLWDDPRVGRLVDITNQSEAAIVGALYWLWATADQHTEDGVMPEMSLRQIDRKTGISGFGAALCEIGWLEEHPSGILIVKFEEHNGASAKRRSLDAQRKANVRDMSASDADKVTTRRGQNAPDCGAREREEKEKSKPLKPKAETQRATRLPADWSPSDEDISFCKTNRPDLDPRQVADTFRDYWHGIAGSKGCKLDWGATWRNWVRNEKAIPMARGSPATGRNDRSAAAAAIFGGEEPPSREIIDVN